MSEAGDEAVDDGLTVEERAELELEHGETLDKLLRRVLAMLGTLRLVVAVGLGAAFLCIGILVAVLWTIHDDDQDDEERRCLVQQEGREGARAGIIDGSVTASVAAAQALIIASGGRDDPRAAAYLAETETRVRADVTAILKEKLPPVEC